MPTTMPTTPRTRAVVSVSDEDAAVAVCLAVGVRGGGGAAASSSPPARRRRSAVRVGAGFAGSGAPFFASSIQRTTSLLSYVWSALKTSWSVSVGREPMDSGNFWNWPGSIVPPLQVTLVTASLICLPCTVSGLASLDLVTSTFQPGTGCGITDASGWSVGKLTSSLTV